MISETRGLAVLVAVYVLCWSYGEDGGWVSLGFGVRVLFRGVVVVGVRCVLVVTKLGWWFLWVSSGLE